MECTKSSIRHNPESPSILHLLIDRYRLVSILIPSSLINTLPSRGGVQKHRPPPPMENITDSLLTTSNILPHQLSRWLRKYKINFLQGFILRLRHKENLVEPSHHRDPAIESESQSSPSHGGLHSAEIVGHDEAAEEERCIRSGHAIRTKIGGVNF